MTEIELEDCAQSIGRTIAKEGFDKYPHAIANLSRMYAKESIEQFAEEIKKSMSIEIQQESVKMTFSTPDFSEDDVDRILAEYEKGT